MEIRSNVRKHHWDFLLFCLGSVLLMAVAFPVFADESDADEFLLEEITVTAQKREENVQKTPLSITAVTGETLKDQGKYRLDEVLVDVAGVALESDTDGTKVVIRGASDNLRTLNEADAPTSIYVDGVIVSDQVQTRAGNYDMSRVEVLRGPQGTLYGYNSLAGSVNLVSNDPEMGSIDTNGSIEIGNYDLIHVEGVVNAPINESMAIRTAVSVENRDGYVSNGSDDSDVKSGRIKYLYYPKDEFRLVISGEYSEVGGNGPGFIEFYASEGDVEDLDDAWETDAELSNDKNDSSSLRLSANVDWDLGFASLVYQPSYSLFEEDVYAEDDDTQSWAHTETPLVSQELRLVSPDGGAFVWTAGLNYLYKDAEADSTTIDDGDVDVVETPTNKTESKAIYGQATYSFSDTLRLTGGARVTHDEKEAVKINNGVRMEGSADYTPFTWKLGLEKDVTDEFLLYGTISTGYRAGGLYYHSELGMVEYDPQEMTAYQIGYKSRLFDDSLQINGEMFYYDYQGYQLSWADMSLAEPQIYIENLDETVNYGGELEGIYFLTRSDRVNFSVAYLQTDLGKMPEGLSQYDYYEQNHSPEWAFNLGYQHNWILPNGGAVLFRADTHYETGSWRYWKQPEGSWQPAYHKSNASLSYDFPSGKWTIQAYVRNIEDYPVMSYFNAGFTHPTDPTASEPDKYLLQAPRTYGIVVSFRY